MSYKLYRQYYSALHKQHLHRVQHLILNEGMSVNHQFQDGAFPLLIAAEKGAFEIVRLLLQLKACPDYKNQHGQNALMLGIQSTEIVQLLILYKCKVNLADGQGRTALHISCGKGLDNCVEVLLKAPARVNVQDKWGRTPLHVALLNISHNQKVTVAYKRTVELLLSSGSNVNKKDSHNSTPLFLAVAAGDECVLIARMLLERGANPDQVSRHRLAPLALATMKGYEKMCRLLLEYNCQVNCTNAVTSRSYLQVAVQKGFFGIADLLLASGCLLHQETWLFAQDRSRTIEHSEGATRWLREKCNAPQELRQLCRARIRQILGHGIRGKVKAIKQYPKVLKKFIMLQDIL